MALRMRQSDTWESVKMVLSRVLVYVARATNTIFHVLMGPHFVPSQLALSSLFSKHWPYDILAFGTLITVTDVSLAVELAYCAWAAVATVLLAWWYQDHVPGGVSIPWQLATRLLVAGVNTYLHRAICLPRRRRQAEARAAAAAVAGYGTSTAGTCTPGGKSSCAVLYNGPASDRQKNRSDCMGGRREQASHAARGSRVTPEAAKGSGLDATAADAAAAVNRPPAACRVSFATAPHSLSGQHGVAECLQSTLAQAKEDNSAGLAPVSARPLYRSCLQRKSAVLKIPWAEPFQVHPDFQLLLGEAVKTHGLASLAAATVERGCIKLTLVIEELAEGPHSGAGAGFPSTARVLEALGVGPGPEGHAEPVWLSLLTLTPAPPGSVAEDGPDPGAPAVSEGFSPVQLTPRVLVAPPPSANSAGALAEGVAAAAAPPRLRLALTVPERLAGGEVEVEVALRSRSGLLASRLVPVSSGGSTATVLRKYDIELLEPPSRPGLVLLDVTAPGLRCALVPLLATADADLAAELAAAAEAWPEAEGESLDHVLYDMATWAAAMYDMTSSSPAYPAAVLEDLTGHLLAFTRDRGWRVASKLLKASLSRVRSSSSHTAAANGIRTAFETDADDDVAAGLAADSGAVGLESELQATERKLGERSWVGSGADDKQASASVPAPVQETGASRAPDWRRAFRLTLGLEAAPADEEAAFCESRVSWAVAVGYPIQVTECLAMLLYLLKGWRVGQGLNLPLLVGVGPGTLGTLLWLVLPHAAGQRLLRVLRGPRYGGIVLSKALFLAMPYPVDTPDYLRGPGVVLLEGVLLSFSIMVSPRTCALLALLRLPCMLIALLVTGVAPTWPVALLYWARVEAASLITTIALNTYLRTRFQQHTATRAPLTAGTVGTSGRTVAGDVCEGASTTTAEQAGTPEMAGSSGVASSAAAGQLMYASAPARGQRCGRGWQHMSGHEKEQTRVLAGHL